MVPCVFFERVLNSFERVPVPRVTENRYGAEQQTVGMGMLRSEFSSISGQMTRVDLQQFVKLEKLKFSPVWLNRLH